MLLQTSAHRNISRIDPVPPSWPAPPGTPLECTRCGYPVPRPWLFSDVVLWSSCVLMSCSRNLDDLLAGCGTDAERHSFQHAWLGWSGGLKHCECLQLSAPTPSIPTLGGTSQEDSMHRPANSSRTCMSLLTEKPFRWSARTIIRTRH